jgi:hypothetical protein
MMGGTTVMTNARHLIEKIRTELKPLEEKIVCHRYLEALRMGSVARERLRIFAAQQYHISASDLRSIVAQRAVSICFPMPPQSLKPRRLCDQRGHPRHHRAEYEHP